MSENLQNLILDTDSERVLSAERSAKIEIDAQMMVQYLHFEIDALNQLLASGNLQKVEDDLTTVVEKALAQTFKNIAQQKDSGKITLREYANFVVDHYGQIDKWRLYDEVHYEDFDKLWVQFQKLRRQDKDYSIFTFIDEHVTDEHREKRRKAGG